MLDICGAERFCRRADRMRRRLGWRGRGRRIKQGLFLLSHIRTEDLTEKLIIGSIQWEGCSPIEEHTQNPEALKDGRGDNP
jgi:hypothetical protein